MQLLFHRGLHHQARICERIREANVQFGWIVIFELVRKPVRLLHPPPLAGLCFLALIRPRRLLC